MNAAAVLPFRDAATAVARISNAEWARRGTVFALTAGVFFAPYLSWRPLQSILFTLSDALFCLAAVLLALSGRITRRPLGAFTPWLLLAYAIMSTGLLLGSIVNGEPLRWAIAMAQYGFALLVLPFLLIGHGEAATRRFSKALIIGLVAMELFGIAIYFLLDGTFEQNSRFGQEFISGSGRLGVFLNDANWNGAVIALTLPFVVYLYAKGAIGRWPAVLAGVVLVTGLVLAASVTALACAVASTLVMLVVGGMRLPKWLVLGVAAAATLYVVGGGPLPRAFDARVAPALSSGNIAQAGTYEGRMELIEEALEIVGSTTFVGIGVDQFREVSAQLAPVHNMYLLMWAEGGLPALFGWMLAVAVLVMTSLLVVRSDRLTAALGLSVLTTLVVSSQASPHMYARLWLVPVFLAIAFVYESAVNRRREAA